jgi:hypothetical protein
MSLRERTRPGLGIIEPCLPSGPGWIHKIKHDGFRNRQLADRHCDEGKARREPLEKRKGLLAKLLNGSHLSIVLNEYYEEDGAIVFREACKLGCEAIVSKRLGSIYRRGRSPHWIKIKNPNAPAVTREAEQDWGRRRRERPAPGNVARVVNFTFAQ